MYPTTENRMFILAINIIIIVAADVVQCGIPWKAEKHKGTEKKHERLLNQTHEYGPKIRAIFLGDSITEGWLYNGHKVWEQFYKTCNAFNYGIGGDRTEHVLWRIENGEFDNIQPSVIVLMIGTNNIHCNTATDIAKGIKVILNELQTKMNRSKILLLSVFPRGGDIMDKNVAAINRIIQNYHDNSHVFYLDVTNSFEHSRGKVVDELYIEDHLHLTEKGYEMWNKVMENEFFQLLNQ